MRRLVAPQKYSAALRWLHWIIALIVLFLWPLGMILDFFRDDVKLDFYLVHESFGFLVLWLMLLRVGARLIAPAPPHNNDPPVQATMRYLVHFLLYVFLIIMPVSGFLATNAHGFPLVWFGLVNVWSPVGKAPEIAGIFSTIHAWSAWALLVLFGIHMAAVLYHHVFRRDETLLRIL